MTARTSLLPHQAGKVFLTDSGLETTLIFHDGIDLPCFAAITLMRTEAGRARLTRYYDDHIAIARQGGFGFVVEGPTWRASADWGDKLGIAHRELATLNRDAVALMLDIKARHGSPALPVVVSGNIGPRGDGYRPGLVTSAAAACSYHSHQIETLLRSGADMISAFTMNTAEEAIGVAQAATGMGAPTVISFTAETDGRLPTGQTLRDAIAAVDDATGGAVAYYMVNCAHPDHFSDAIPGGDDWVARIGGLRPNASRLSHAELDEATALDDGNPEEFGDQLRSLAVRHPGIAVIGGCCGTDLRHIERTARALAQG